MEREGSELVSAEKENIKSFRGKFIKKYWSENACFQISCELQFGRHIPGGNLSRVEYAIEMTNNVKDLIPPSLEDEIVSKLYRNFHDDMRTAIIIRNVKTFHDSIELVDAFDPGELPIDRHTSSLGSLDPAMADAPPPPGSGLIGYR